MNLRALPYPPLTLLKIMGLAALAVSVSAAPQKKNPTSKFYVVDLTGESQIDDGTKIQPLEKNGVHVPQGSVVETKAKSTDSLILSNGTAMYIAPDSRVEFKHFLQQPFTPNRNDLDVEPSVSQMMVQLQRGGVGLCTSQMVAGSTMVYKTPQATIDIRGRRLMIQTDDEETRVSLLEGDVTVIGDPTKTGEVLRAGQQAIVRRPSPGAPFVVTVQPIPDSENAKLDEMVSLACISRRTVYFESVDRSGDGTTADDLVPVRTTAANAPTQFTISPSRINP